MRIAFDLDETLGVPMVDSAKLIGWQTRVGCSAILQRLHTRATLCLWSVAGRRYVEKALSFGLERWFEEIYTWDELPGPWKDIRRIRADFLVDDSPHHREAACKEGIESGYILVPGYGCPEDVIDPMAWVRVIEEVTGR